MWGVGSFHTLAHGERGLEVRTSPRPQGGPQGCRTGTGAGLGPLPRGGADDKHSGLTLTGPPDIAPGLQYLPVLLKVRSVRQNKVTKRLNTRS